MPIVEGREELYEDDDKLFLQWYVQSRDFSFIECFIVCAVVCKQQRHTCFTCLFVKN